MTGGTPQRLTIHGHNDSAIWSPDGTRLAFVSFRDGPANLYAKSVDGGEAYAITPAAEPEGWELYRYPSAWSPDGRLIAFHQLSADRHWDVFTVPANGVGEPQAIAGTPANEYAARFSPDGAWIAYVSDHSGREEVYVQPYPPTGGEWRVSEGGGVFPVWSSRGDEIFYVGGDGSLLAVTIQTDTSFSHGTPEALFEYVAAFSPRRPVPEFDVEADGERFLTWEREDVTVSTWSFAVVLDWSADPRLWTSPDP